MAGNNYSASRIRVVIDEMRPFLPNITTPEFFKILTWVRQSVGESFGIRGHQELWYVG